MFFKHPQAWRRFARINQACAGAGQFGVVARCFSGDTAHALQNIQGRALSGQNTARRTRHGQNFDAFLDAITVFNKFGDFQPSVVARKDSSRNIDARNVHRFACIHMKSPDGLFINHELRSEVTRADIFGQPKID